MPNPQPLSVSADEVLHYAIQARAAKEGTSPVEVVLALLRQALAAEIEEARGVPPLAAVIQQHHRRQQAAQKPTGPSPQPP